MPQILAFFSADNVVLVFLRRGSTVMVEVAPEISNLDCFSKCSGNGEQTFVVLHSIQKYSRTALSYKRQNKIWDPEQLFAFLDNWAAFEPGWSVIIIHTLGTAKKVEKAFLKTRLDHLCIGWKFYPSSWQSNTALYGCETIWTNSTRNTWIFFS